MDNTVQKQLEELKKEVEQLKQKRVYQQDVIPGAIKQRHMGEGPNFIRSGTSRPTTGENATDSSAIYFDTSTGVLSIWDGTQWLETTLS